MNIVIAFMKKDSKERDLQLFRSYKEGNNQALKILFNLHKSRLSIYFRNCKCRKDETQDLVLITFERVCKKSHLMDEERPFSVWLMAIARNILIDHKRSYYQRNRDKFFSINEPRDSKSSKTKENIIYIKRESGHDDFEAKQLFAAISSTLSAEQKRVFGLYYTKELSYKEIAEEMNISIGTVKTHIFRARKILKSEMKKEVA